LSQGTRKIVKKGASVCYSVSAIKDTLALDASAGNETVTIMDGNDTILLAIVYRNSTSTITCPGVATTVFDSTCLAAWDVLYPGILPPTGACTYGGACAF
jgi:hypothetical protein